LLLDDHKVICTMSPAASVSLVATTYDDESGNQLYGYAEVPAKTHGVITYDDWDALGHARLRSNSVSFHDVHLAASALRGGFPPGCCNWLHRAKRGQRSVPCRRIGGESPKRHTPRVLSVWRRATAEP
jgi:hypothetical protein